MSVKQKLMVLVASTRPGRVGSTVGKWAALAAADHGSFDVELVELADLNLPIFDEPEHPAKRAYVHEHTKAWSKRVDEADAFVIVTPEYNFGMPPSLLNALTYLVHEWHYKPAAFVSYGGVSGGIRSVQDAKQALTTFKVVPMYEAVVIPHVHGHLSDEGDFVPEPIHQDSAVAMLDELAKWSRVLIQLRQTGETK